MKKFDRNCKKKERKESKEVPCCFEMILLVAPHKTAAVRPLTPNHTDEQNKLVTAGKVG